MKCVCVCVITSDTSEKGSSFYGSRPPKNRFAASIILLSFHANVRARELEPLVCLLARIASDPQVKAMLSTSMDNAASSNDDISLVCT